MIKKNGIREEVDKKNKKIQDNKNFFSDYSQNRKTNNKNLASLSLDWMLVITVHHSCDFKT